MDSQECCVHVHAPGGVLYAVTVSLPCCRVRMDNLGVMANREHLADRDHLEKMYVAFWVVMASSAHFV